MQMPRMLVGLGLAAGITAASQAALPPMAGDQPLPSLAPMLDQVLPAVVNVSTRTPIKSEDHPLLSDPLFRRFFNLPEREQNSLGSGVILDAARGHVITNHHVIHKAREIRVTLKDGRQLPARVLGSDPETDIALLGVSAQGLKAIPLGRANQLRVGDFVVAIGNPFGLGQTVTSGIVSALGRTGLGIEGFENFIQTDASINPGNSGGPLVNLRGELVGINTAILAPNGGNVGIGFAIPVDVVQAVATQLVSQGEVKRGRLDIQLQEPDPELAKAMGVEGRHGALVVQVGANSAAFRAGLRAGDLVIALDGTPLTGAADLRNRIGLTPVGSKIVLEVANKDRIRRVELVLTDPLQSYVKGERYHPLLAGCLLGEILDHSDLGDLEAVEVGQVDPRGKAHDLGLRKGDVLLEFNRKRITGLPALAAVAKQATKGFSLKLRRGEDLVNLVAR